MFFLKIGRSLILINIPSSGSRFTRCDEVDDNLKQSQANDEKRIYDEIDCRKARDRIDRDKKKTRKK